MRAVAKPTDNPSHVFELCIGSIDDIDLWTRLNSILSVFVAAAIVYEKLAIDSALFTIPETPGNNATVVFGGVTKGELKGVYTQHFVPKEKPGRRIYESLLSLSKGKQCPLCGFGQVKTLDHYLPKAKFPLYSVLPANLVPACRDCNTGKLASTANQAKEQSIHPYFDKAHFFSDQWLFATVEQKAPAAVRFYVQPPQSWDQLSKDRANSHFESFALSDRFSIEVANQLTVLLHELEDLSDEAMRREHLQQRAECYMKVHKNSWQTALHQALANSAWYCQDGFSAGWDGPHRENE